MKNKFMRIAAVMLMLCLVTTCAISGTFAKYTTENTATDDARVAKWGVVITPPSDATNATFSKTYTDNDETFNGDSVVSTEDVIAPGTKGTLATPTISGTPEVAVRVTLDATLTLTGWEVTIDGNTSAYCPLVFTVKGATTETFKIGDDGINSVTDLKAKVEAAIEKYSKDYAAGTNLETGVQNDIPTVEWAWAFETAGNNANDTALGDAAADDNADNNPTIEFSIKVTISQID